MIYQTRDCERIEDEYIESDSELEIQENSENIINNEIKLYYLLMTSLRLPRDNNNANGFCEIREYWSKDPIFFTNNFLKISIKCINYKNIYQHF